MIKRDPGFMGLAKQKAKREGMFEVPKRYQPQGGGAEEYPAFLNQQEMGLLKQQGGKGFMTPYGIPSFAEESYNPMDSQLLGGANTGYNNPDIVNSALESMNRDPYGNTVNSPHDNTAPGSGGSGGSGGSYVPPQSGGGSDGQNKQQQAMMAAAAARAKAEAAAKAKAAEEVRIKKEAEQKRKYEEKKRLDDKRSGYIDGVMTDESGKKEGEEGYDANSASMKGGYEGYKGEAKELGAESKGITDSFGQDAENLAGYQDKFDTMAGEAKDRGDKGEAFQQEQGTKLQDAAGAGATKLEGFSDDVGTAATEGAAGLKEGAKDVGAVKDQFGKDGFQSEAGGLQNKSAGYESKISEMADRAASGDVGQSQAAMLKGQMEEGRMASQKGGEEKLRREMAQSGASPAEIASKVAQFQQKSAASQAQAGRSETLSSQLQGQQMGQSQLGQAAGLTGQAMGALNQQSGMLGQKAGMAGQQASLGAQQAALRGQAAGMQMQGAGQQAGITGAATNTTMQGITGNAAMNAQGTQIGQAGASQQASMMGQGMGAVQAAGGAKQQQMSGLDQQGGFIDQQGNYTEKQLDDTVAKSTQNYSEEQASLTRAAQGTPDAPGYVPPVDTGTASTAPTGAPPAPTGIAQPGGIMAQAKPQGRMMAEQDQIKATAPGGGAAATMQGQAPPGIMGAQAQMGQQGMLGQGQGGIAQQGGIMGQGALTPEMRRMEEQKRNAINASNSIT